MIYKTIYADPPWMERGGGKIKRGADRHYPLMHSQDIANLGHYVRQIVHPEGCWLHMWVTNNFLEDGLCILKQWGFRYINMRTWAKDRQGLGQYARGQTEHILFGVCGKLARKTYKPPTLIGCGILPRRKHSQKPPEAREEIEQMGHGPFLELFGREEIEGWTVLGNQIGEGRDIAQELLELAQHAATMRHLPLFDGLEK